MTQDMFGDAADQAARGHVGLDRLRLADMVAQPRADRG